MDFTIIGRFAIKFNEGLHNFLIKMNILKEITYLIVILYKITLF